MKIDRTYLLEIWGNREPFHLFSEVSVSSMVRNAMESVKDTFAFPKHEILFVFFETLNA